jgi:hypothetical protein
MLCAKTGWFTPGQASSMVNQQVPCQWKILCGRGYQPSSAIKVNNRLTLPEGTVSGIHNALHEAVGFAAQIEFWVDLGGEQGLETAAPGESLGRPFF